MRLPPMASACLWLSVAWPPWGDDDIVLKILLRCYDREGLFINMELLPWWLDVPHEDVNFASGQSAIEPSEQGKLDRALETIHQTLRRYEKNYPVRVYVAGHTIRIRQDMQC